MPTLSYTVFAFLGVYRRERFIGCKETLNGTTNIATPALSKVYLNSLWHFIYLQGNRFIGLQRRSHPMPQARAEMARFPKPKSRHTQFWLLASTLDRQKNLLSARSLLALVLLLSPLESSAQDFWQWQNPLPQGNTLRAVHALNANVLYAVGDAGAILKTTNGGSKWVVQSSGTTTRLHGAWFFDAAKGIVVGDSGTMLRTTDGGATWSTHTWTGPWDWALDIAVDPADPGLLYVATGQNGVNSVDLGAG